MSRTFTQPKSSRLDQDATLDQISAGAIVDKNPLRKPMSLRPDLNVMAGCVENQPYALAIRDAWAPNYRVTVMAADEFDALVERCYMAFHGLDKDLDDSASIKQAQEQAVDCA